MLTFFLRLRSSKNFSETSDVYSYGVFLLELISGREAHGRVEPSSQQNLVLQVCEFYCLQWLISLKYLYSVCNRLFPSLILKAKCINDLNNFMDKTLGAQAMNAVKEMMELALACVDISVRRPTMKNVVEELEGTQHREIGHLQTQFGGEIGVVTLGSELFK